MARVVMSGVETEMRDALLRNHDVWVQRMGERALTTLLNDAVLKVRKLVGEVRSFENTEDSKWLINGEMRVSVSVTYRNDTGKYYNSVKALKN